jgi:hypothetical protein
MYFSGMITIRSQDGKVQKLSVSFRMRIEDEVEFKVELKCPRAGNVWNAKELSIIHWDGKILEI